MNGSPLDDNVTDRFSIRFFFVKEWTPFLKHRLVCLGEMKISSTKDSALGDAYYRYSERYETYLIRVVLTSLDFFLRIITIFGVVMYHGYIPVREKVTVNIHMHIIHNAKASKTFVTLICLPVSFGVKQVDMPERVYLATG
jgi:hypothetical protein